MNTFTTTIFKLSTGDGESGGLSGSPTEKYIGRYSLFTKGYRGRKVLIDLKRALHELIYLPWLQIHLFWFTHRVIVKTS